MNVPQSRSRISIRPSMIKGKGVMDVVDKLGKAVAPALVDLASEFAKKKLSGGMAIPIKISTAQKRALKKGGAITIKPDMISEVAKEALALLPTSAKKIMSSLSKNKGIRYALKKGEDLVNRMTGKGFFEDLGSVFQKVAEQVIDPIKQIGHDAGQVYAPIPELNPFDLGYKLGNEVIGPALLGKGMKKRRGRKPKKRGGDAFTDFFTKTIPSAFVAKVDEYKANPQNAVADFLDTRDTSLKNPLTNKSIEGEMMRGGPEGTQNNLSLGGIRKNIFGSGGMKHSVGVRNGSAYSKVGGRMCCGGSFVPAGGSIYTAGGSFVPAGKRGGMMGCGIDMPIQLGTPFLSMNSPAMRPFIPTHSIQSSQRII